MFHCLVIKVVYLSLSVRQLVYITTSIFVCQQLFLFSFEKLSKLFKKKSRFLRSEIQYNTGVAIRQPLFFNFFDFFTLFDKLYSISIENAHKYLHKHVLIIQEIKESILLNQRHSLFSQ